MNWPFSEGGGERGGEGVGRFRFGALTVSYIV